MSRQPEQDVKHLLERNRILTGEIQRRVRQLAAINTVAAAVSQSLDLDLTLDTALEAVLSVVDVEAAGISLVDKAANELVLRATRGWTLDFVSEPMRIDLGKGLSGQVVAEDTVLVTGDLTDDDRLAVPAFSDEHVQALAMAPMHAGGEVTGVLSVMSHHPYEFTTEQIDVLKSIADQVGVALENARLYQQTANQRERLNAVIHSAADAIIATDAEGRIIVLNHAARMLFDMRTDTVIGRPLLETAIKPSLREALSRTLNHNTDSADMFDLTLEDGRTLTAVVSSLQRGQQQAMHGWVIVLRDISHLKEAEAARLEFVRTAAHDLRNPLGVTLSALMMLKDFLPGSDPTLDEIFGIAVEAVNRMQALLDDMLNLEHIHSGIGFETTLIDPLPLLQSVLRDMGPVMTDREQQFRLDAPDALPETPLAMDWFQRAVMNYLSNASKYTQRGGEIVLRARQENDSLIVEVEDNGPGIPLDAQNRLFERFYRVPTLKEDDENHSEVRGSGLGLAIVKSIVEAHGGRVYVRSAPREGSTFGLALPLADSPD